MMPIKNVMKSLNPEEKNLRQPGPGFMKIPFLLKVLIVIIILNFDKCEGRY